jgi:hypothetical protein
MAAFSATGMNPDRYNASHFCPSLGSELNADSFISILKKLLIFIM